MRKIKTPREARVMPITTSNLKTYHDVASTMIPFRSAQNLRHCHYIRGDRDIIRIDRRDWESVAAVMLRGVEKQRFNLKNRFFNALEQVHLLLKEVQEKTAEKTGSNLDY